MADPRAESDTGRIEAFSDGVFAVAITLLALNLSVPQRESSRPWQGLAQALLNQWPVYLAYVLSFLTILIIWINHHNLFKHIKRTDQVFLLLNGLLLMVVTTLPFATALLASYLQQPDKRVAQVVYSGASLLMALTYNRMWAYASHEGRLLGAEADQRLVRSVTEQFSIGPPSYIAAFLLAFVSAEASLGLCMLLAIFFALPSTVGRVVATLYRSEKGTPGS